MLNESYAEAGCKRKTTAGTMAAKAGLIVLCVVLVMLSMLSQVFVVIAVAAIALTVFFFPRFNVEYEYVFCDGQIDFDKISGGQKRKTKLRIDFEQVEICAPIKAHELDGYTYKDLQVVDFSSGTETPNTYAIILHDKGVTKKVIFEPNEKMLSCIRQKAPRKIMKQW